MKVAAAALLAFACSCAGCITDEKREAFQEWTTKKADESYLARQAKGQPAPAYSYAPGDVSKALVATAPITGRVALECLKQFAH